jgi:hypothetical protein
MQRLHEQGDISGVLRIKKAQRARLVAGHIGRTDDHELAGESGGVVVGKEASHCPTSSDSHKPLLDSSMFCSIEV